MPATAQGLAKRAGVDLDEHSLTEPELNLDLGMRYLSRLSKRWGGSDSAVALAIPSYNAGAGAVDKCLPSEGAGISTCSSRRSRTTRPVATPNRCSAVDGIPGLVRLGRDA